MTQELECKAGERITLVELGVSFVVVAVEGDEISLVLEHSEAAEDLAEMSMMLAAMENQNH